MRATTGLNLSPTLSLRQQLAPQLIQQMGRFQMSYPQLMSALESEQQDNPFLVLERFDDRQTNASPLSSDIADTLDPFSSIASTGPSLRDHLLAQVDTLYLSSKLTELVSFWIDELDSRGYVPDYSDSKRQLIERYQVSDRQAFDTLKIVQSLDPPGVGARSLKECLFLQATQLPMESAEAQSALEELISHHLDLLESGHPEQAASELGVSTQDLETLIDYVRSNMDPEPGRQFGESHSAPPPISPSFRVRLIDDQVHIENLEFSKDLTVRVSESAKRQLNDPALSPDEHRFLQDQRQRAVDWVAHLSERRERLNRLVDTIVRTQIQFLEYGFDYLVPLFQKDLATVLGQSPGTTSRLLNTKFVDTPHGIVSLAALCPRGRFGKTATQLHRIVRDIAHQHPDYSDQQIRSEMADRGYPIARRTVAKYRHIESVPSSYERKRSKSSG